MSKKTDIAKAEATDLAAVEAQNAADLLAFFDDPDMVDGLEEFGGEDIKIGSILWNMRGKDKHGNSMTKDVFFDTISEETVKTIDVVMLTTKKTKKWDEFDKDLDKTIVHCQSADRVTGTMADGTRRPCNDCPDDGWFTDEKGKPMRKCGNIHNVVAAQLPSEKPIMIRFKKTGLSPFQKYSSTHHKNARVHVDPKTKKKSRRNVPLFAIACRMTLKMSDNDMYSIPVLEPIKQGEDADGAPLYMLPTQDILSYGAAAKDWSAMANEAISAADKQSAAYTDAPDDSNVDANEFADDDD